MGGIIMTKARKPTKAQLAKVKRNQSAYALFMAVSMGAVVVGVGTPSAQSQVNQPSPQATAQVVNAENQEIGIANLTQTGYGVEIALNLRNLPANGNIAFHVHKVGKCESDKKFETAADHFNPTGKQHGHKSAGGAHAGDMPNQKVAADGTLVTSILNTAITLDDNPRTGIMDADGSALVFHANADDYTTQPTGNAGGRIACGVITSITGS
jgi:Cu-Zn family superoxide dismutase